MAAPLSVALLAATIPTMAVQRDPGLVFLLVGLIFGCVGFALLFASPLRPRFGSSPGPSLTPRELARLELARRRTDLPWMPGGDALSRPAAASPGTAAPPTSDPPPTADAGDDWGH